MKAHALLKLHERQCRLIEMIIDCDQRISQKKCDIRSYSKAIPGTYYVGHLTKMILKYRAVKQRLISYYKDIQIRIMTLQPEIELNTSTEMDLVTTLS